MLERRRDPRSPIYKRGFIKFGPAGKDVPCTVNDLTSGGAGLSVGTTFGLPRVFQMAIEGEVGVRHCRVIWMDGKKLGVTFA